MKADLHIHSLYSDGALDVKELITKAKEASLDVISITDHDTLDGYKNLDINNIEGIKIIYGIEVSSYYNNETIHVLGFLKDLNECMQLKKVLETMKKQREKRALDIADLLKKHFNIDINRELLLNNNCITRGNIANCIKMSGYNYSKEDIFKNMIGNGCKAYIPATKMPTKQAINMLHEAGAIAVLAHPVLIKNNNVEEILDLGFDGIESIYPQNKQNDTIRFKQLAKNRGMVITAGSDFHTYNDFKHGNIGCVHLEGNDLKKFLCKVGVDYEC